MNAHALLTDASKELARLRLDNERTIARILHGRDVLTTAIEMESATQTRIREVEARLALVARMIQNEETPNAVR